MSNYWRSKVVMENLFTAFEHCNEVVVFDTETTGFSADKDRVIQFSGIKYTIDSNGEMHEKDVLDLYINPERTLPPKIVELTGITDEMLFDVPVEEEQFPLIEAFLDGVQVISGYNNPFDMRFLNAMYARYNKTIEFPYELDVLEMARDLVDKSSSPSHKLRDIAELYGVDEGLQFHNSLDDVRATAALLQVFYYEYKDKESLRQELIAGPKKTARVFSIKYWAGHRKEQARIYVNTSLGTFYYNCLAKNWCGKDDNRYTIDEVDMEKLRQDAWQLAGATNEPEFARFRG